MEVFYKIQCNNYFKFILYCFLRYSIASATSTFKPFCSSYFYLFVRYIDSFQVIKTLVLLNILAYSHVHIPVPELLSLLDNADIRWKIFMIKPFPHFLRLTSHQNLKYKSCRLNHILTIQVLF